MNKFNNTYQAIKKKLHSLINAPEPEDKILEDSPAVGDFIEIEKDDSDSDYTPSFMDIDQTVEADPVQVRKIFNSVLEVFNENMPTFLSSSVDPEKQKKYLYDMLDSSVKDYLSSLEESAQARCMAQWKSERESQKNEMENLRQRARDLEAKKAEMNEQKLSSDRQKRHLTERVRDLEKKVMELEAEKEQLDIENKSLLNKAKVANIYETDIEAMRTELEELKKHQSNQDMTEENDQLKAENARLNAEIKRLNDACEAAKLKDEMGGAMFKDMQKKASEANKDLKEAEAKLEKANSDLAIKDAKIDDLTQQIDQTQAIVSDKDLKIEELKRLIAEKDEKIAEDEESLAGIQSIVDQLETFQKVKANLEDKIRKLRDELKEAQKESLTLRSTIQNNIYAQAQQQKELQDEIEALRSNASRNN